jgi:hypothetical protein
LSGWPVGNIFITFTFFIQFLKVLIAKDRGIFCNPVICGSIDIKLGKNAKGSEKAARKTG